MSGEESNLGAGPTSPARLPSPSPPAGGAAAGLRRRAAGGGRRRRSGGAGRAAAGRHLHQSLVGSIVSKYLGRRLIATTLAVAVFVMGLAFGAAGTKSLGADQRGEIESSLKQFVTGAKENDLGDPGSIARSLVYENSVKTVGFFWLLGLSVVGAPLILVLLFSKGFALGFSVGFLVESLSAKGLLLAVASIMPHNLITVPALLIGAIASLSVAGSLALRRYRGRAEGERGTVAQELTAFTVLSAIIAVALAVGAFVQGYVTPVLIGIVARATG